MRDNGENPCFSFVSCYVYKLLKIKNEDKILKKVISLKAKIYNKICFYKIGFSFNLKNFISQGGKNYVKY